jgi:hypothetical protein
MTKQLHATVKICVVMHIDGHCWPYMICTGAVALHPAMAQLHLSQHDQRDTLAAAAAVRAPGERNKAAAALPTAAAAAAFTHPPGCAAWLPCS